LGNATHNPFTPDETLNLGLSNSGIVEEGDESDYDSDDEEDRVGRQQA
jgi:hypothetical protein